MLKSVIIDMMFKKNIMVDEKARDRFIKGLKAGLEKI